MKYLELAPFAITSDGVLFINAATTTSTADLETVVHAAVMANRVVFVGIMLTSEETEFAMGRLNNAADETSARIIGQQRVRRRNTNGGRE